MFYIYLSRQPPNDVSYIIMWYNIKAREMESVQYIEFIQISPVLYALILCVCVSVDVYAILPRA